MNIIAVKYGRHLWLTEASEKADTDFTVPWRVIG